MALLALFDQQGAQISQIIVTGHKLALNRAVAAHDLKRAEWDDEGTLRLKWREGNDKAKGKRAHVKSALMETVFDSNETLILEGVQFLARAEVGEDTYVRCTLCDYAASNYEETGIVRYSRLKKIGPQRPASAGHRDAKTVLSSAMFEFGEQR